MSEAEDLAVDAPVSPCRVLGIEAQHELAQLGGRGPASGSSSLAGIGPTACDQSSVPADHRFGFHDQQHLVEMAAVEGPGENGEYGAISWCESRSVDLVSQGEDLSDTVITGDQQHANTVERESDQPRDELPSLLFHPPKGRDENRLPPAATYSRQLSASRTASATSGFERHGDAGSIGEVVEPDIDSVDDESA